jgi:uncharacterized protein with von Willebrand factor type A (vWA) domain
MNSGFSDAMNSGFSDAMNSTAPNLDLSSLLRQGALELDPEKAENGLAKLVLTVVELLRQLCERQAVRRMEHGNLSDEDIERLGDAFLRLNETMQQLKTTFGFSDEDLNLDLGPLGHLR